MSSVRDGERGWVEVSALVSVCLEHRAGRSQACGKPPHICDPGLFVLSDTA